MKKDRFDPFGDKTWLAETQPFGPTLDERQLVWIRHFIVYSLQDIPPPHSHPYCEFNLLVRGRLTQFVEGEEARRRAGDILLIGPAVPHWAAIGRCPFECIVAYFQPWVFVECGDSAAGERIVRRFTARQPISGRLARPPARLRRRIIAAFRNMADEFERKEFGSNLRLRAILTKTLVEFLRWECKAGREVVEERAPVNWHQVEQALQYIRAHFTEPLYVCQVAAAAGLSRAALQRLLHDAIGMPWVKYLQGYRIHRAALMLQESHRTVSEVAFTSGFESLSHFNATFRLFTGLPPSEYARRFHAVPRQK